MNGFTPNPHPDHKIYELLEMIGALTLRVACIENRLESPWKLAPDAPASSEAKLYFDEIWNAWPSKRPDGHFARGNRTRAWKSYSKCLSKVYTPEILAQAAGLYLMDVDDHRNGYLMMVATFFGPDKATWLEYAAPLVDRIKHGV